MHNQDSIFSTIKQIYPDTEEIIQPDIKGYVHKTFIVRTYSDNKFICRFVDKKTAIHNLYVSNLLTEHDIPVPKVTIHQQDSQYIETYSFIDGKTFQERLIEGIEKEKLYNIYHQLFNMAYKISKIPYNKETKLAISLPTYLISTLFKILNPKLKKQLCHHDLYPSNVILDDQDNIKSLIDLDSVTPVSLGFSLFVIIRDVATRKYCDLNTLEQMILCIPSQYARIPKLNTQLKIFEIERKITRFFIDQDTCKQLLKIRVK